ncbi:MAG: hydrogenase maturation nickel metallochaperone HypA [Ignavibacteria bacterium]|nr:hydrogenase maturation nickel metallochaperone HypA [Ignavibacteria bacterium]
MHELVFAQEIINIAKSFVPNSDGTIVKSIKLEVGEFSNIVPESLEMCFEILVQGTQFEGAKLDFDLKPLKFKCIDCAEISQPDYPFFVCPNCSSSNVEILSGLDSKVVEIVTLE